AGFSGKGDIAAHRNRSKAGVFAFLSFLSSLPPNSLLLSTYTSLLLLTSSSPRRRGPRASWRCVALGSRLRGNDERGAVSVRARRWGVGFACWSRRSANGRGPIL